MEAFSLLKYWRGGGLVSPSDPHGRSSAATTIVSTALPLPLLHHPPTADSTDDDDDDDGPFFDLEFAVRDGGEEEEEEEEDGGVKGDENRDSSSDTENDDDGDNGDDAGEFNFTLSPSSSSSSSVSGDGCPGSPSDGLFFKGRLLPIEQPEQPEPNSTKPNHLPVSLMKSATKLRVFMLGLKKAKPDQQKDSDLDHDDKSQTAGKLLSVKVEEVPIMSLFTRDSGSKSQKLRTAAASPMQEATSDEKIFFSKEAMNRYLKKVKPLYVRVSRRYGDKLRFSTGSGPKAPAEHPKPADAGTGSSCVKGHIRRESIPAGLRVVCKHLGKSRSASSAVAAVPPGCGPSSSSSSRRDDSLLQQQDGIQSAILHCKRSFHASRDSESEPSFLLARSVSEPLQEKSIEPLRNSS